MSGASERQQAANAPPRDGAIIVLTVDGTSRGYDLGAIALGGAAIKDGGVLEITMIASATTYFKFDDDSTATVDETAADAVGVGPTFQANAAALLPANTYLSVLINRVRDRYLFLKGSAGTLRIWASSQRTVR